MRFKRLDLNLLVALDALLTERSITRAAKKLNLTQPATSNALSRLRDYFKDELLVLVGRRMEPTPRARSLEPAVRELLGRIDAALYTSPAFDPTLSQREFTLYVTDLSMQTLLPQVQLLAARQRSQVRFRLKFQQRDLMQVLDRSELDLLIAPLPFCSREHPLQELYELDHVGVVWRESALAREPLTKEVYREALHAVRQLPDDYMPTAFNAWFLENYGASCRVGLSTYSYSALPWLVIGTEMIATVPRQLAQQLQALMPIQLCPLPEPSLKFRLAMQWNQQRADDPGLLWLRDLILQAVASMQDGPLLSQA